MIYFGINIWLQVLDQDFLTKRIDALFSQWDNCLKKGGDNIEK